VSRQTIILPFGTPGSASEAEIYLLREDVRNAAAEAALAVSEDAGGNVIVSGVPESLSIEWTLLWRYQGQSGAERVTDPPSPPGIVVAIDEPGLDAEDIGHLFYAAGVELAAAPAVAPVLPFGYWLTGLPQLTSPGTIDYFASYGAIRQVARYRSGYTATDSALLMATLIDARLDQAAALAAVLAPTATFVKGGRNRKAWEPEAGSRTYLRGYERRATGPSPLSAGEHTVSAITGLIVIQIFLELETSDTLALQLADTMRPAFFTGDDGLEFEEGWSFRNLGRPPDSAHWMASCHFPYRYLVVGEGT
jgi:hypothetical protein